MKSIYFAGQDNFGNRGCEALIRSSVKIIRERHPMVRFMVPSKDIERDTAQWRQAEDSGATFIGTEPFPSKLKWWSRAHHVWPGVEKIQPRFSVSKPTEDALNKCSAVIMTGGDVISLDYGVSSLYYWSGICEAAMRAGTPTVLWGASIGPFDRCPDVEKKMRTFLSRFDLVTARESFTYSYMKKLGVENVHNVADPAFCLDAEPSEFRERYAESDRKVLGFNVSPLMQKFRGGQEPGPQLDKELTGFCITLLDTTDLCLLLIPHVDALCGCEVNSDWIYMKGLTERVLMLRPDLRHRIELVPRGLNAAQMKGIIGTCAYFIGARTHATIAAISQGIPTISIAYSVKSKGINHDIFGNLDYVLDTSALTSALLLSRLEILRSSDPAIRETLERRVPQLQNAARRSAELLDPHM